MNHIWIKRIQRKWCSLSGDLIWNVFILLSCGGCNILKPHLKYLFFSAQVTVFTIPPSVKYFLISFQHKSATPWVWPTFLSIGLHLTSSPIHPGCLLSLQSWLIGFIDQRRVRMNPLQMQLRRTQCVLRDTLPPSTENYHLPLLVYID